MANQPAAARADPANPLQLMGFAPNFPLYGQLAMEAAMNGAAAAQPYMQQMMTPGLQTNLGNQAYESAVAGAAPGMLTPLFQFLSSYPIEGGNVAASVNQSQGMQGSALNQAIANAYGNELNANLGAYTQGPYSAAQNLQGDLGALGDLTQIQSLQGLTPARMAEALGQPLSSVEQSEIGAQTLPLSIAQQEYTQGVVPQQLARFGLAQNAQNILGQENIAGLNQQGALNQTALNNQAQQLINQLSQGSGVENVNTQTQGSLLSALNQAMENAAVTTGGQNLAGRQANLSAGQNLEQQAQGLEGTQAQLTQQLNQATRMGNLNSANIGLQTTVPAYLQGALAALGATSGGQFQTQNNAANLASQLTQGDISGALQPGNVLAAIEPTQLTAEGNLLGNENSALAGTYLNPTLSAIQQLGGVGGAAINAQTAGGSNANTNNAADFQTALQSVAKDQALQNVMGELFGGSGGAGGLIRQIGTGPGSSPLGGSGIPLAAYIPSPATSATGYSSATGEPFQSVNYTLASGDSGAATPSPIAANAVAAASNAPAPSFAEQLANDMKSAMAFAPNITNPYSERNTADVMSPIMAEGAKQTVAPQLLGLSQAPGISNPFNVNPSQAQNYLTKIGSFDNPYQGPLDNISQATMQSDPLANPLSSFDVPLVGRIANGYRPDDNLSLGSPLSTGLVQGPDGSWANQFTGGVGSVPSPGIVDAHNPALGSLPDVTGMLANLSQQPNVSSGPLTGFLGSLFSNAAAQSQRSRRNVSPWSGLAAPVLSLPGGPNFENPRVMSNVNVNLPKVPPLSSLIG